MLFTSSDIIFVGLSVSSDLKDIFLCKKMSAKIRKENYRNENKLEIKYRSALLQISGKNLYRKKFIHLYFIFFSEMDFTEDRHTLSVNTEPGFANHRAGNSLGLNRGLPGDFIILHLSHVGIR